jgi:SAM-dependent methyltransferase
MTRPQRLVFGEDAELYDRVRPSYPDELIDDVVGLVGTPCRAVDAGCGTGRVAVALADRGFQVVGVEPDPAMAAVARRNLAPYPCCEVEESDFEDWTPPLVGSFGLVTSGQAWHWIDSARGARVAERALRRGGWLAILRTDWEREATPLRRMIDAAYAEHEPGNSTCVAPEPGKRLVPEDSEFGEAVRREYRWSQTFTAAEWLELLRTASNHRLHPDQRREQLFAAISDAISAEGGTYQHRYLATLWALQRS